MDKMDVFAIRLSKNDRQLFDALAQQMQRTTGDAIRVIVRREAVNLGVTQPPRPEQVKQVP